MISWKFSASFESCTLIFLQGCVFFEKFFGQYLKGERQMSTDTL